ncbi:MAG: hypothetical protein ABL996_14625 [Micropepsaceae bacterium]
MQPMRAQASFSQSSIVPQRSRERSVFKFKRPRWLYTESPNAPQVEARQIPRTNLMRHSAKLLAAISAIALLGVIATFELTRTARADDDDDCDAGAAGTSSSRDSSENQPSGEQRNDGGHDADDATDDSDGGGSESSRGRKSGGGG